jgi:hypothetical protein
MGGRMHIQYLFWCTILGFFVALSLQQTISEQVAVEGVSMNIIISCTLRLDVAPFWIINGSVYELFSIPQNFLFGVIPVVDTFSALIIPQVTTDLTGLVFQCASFNAGGMTILGVATRLIVVPCKRLRGMQSLGHDKGLIPSEAQCSVTDKIDASVNLIWPGSSLAWVYN